MSRCAGFSRGCGNSEILLETAPCADLETTKESAVARSTRETRRVRRPPAAARDSSPRPRQATRAARAKPDPGAETNQGPPARPATPACSDLQLLIRRPVVGHMLTYRCSVMIHAACLTPSKVADCRGKTRVRDE